MKICKHGATQRRMSSDSVAQFTLALTPMSLLADHGDVRCTVYTRMCGTPSSSSQLVSSQLLRTSRSSAPSGTLTTLSHRPVTSNTSHPAASSSASQAGTRATHNSPSCETKNVRYAGRVDGKRAISVALPMRQQMTAVLQPCACDTSLATRRFHYSRLHLDLPPIGCCF